MLQLNRKKIELSCKWTYNFFLLTLILLLSSCWNKDATQLDLPITDNSNYVGIKVSTTTANKEKFNNQIISNGVVEAENRSELRFKVSEQIENIYVENGEEVKEGYVLANLDNKLLKSELVFAEIAFSKAQRQLMEQKIFFGVNDMEEKDIDPKILKTIYHKSGYETAKNLLATAQLRFEQTFLKMPFSGTVANLVIKEGSSISPSEIFCIALSNTDLNVIFYILESELSRVVKGQALEIIPFTSQGAVFSGEIVEINPLVNEDGLVRVTGKIKNPLAYIFDGMNVKVIINIEFANVTVIPKEAVVQRSNRSVVFTVKDGLAKWNYVEIMAENTRNYAIGMGLNAGDTIVISGNLNLTQDAQVNPTYIREVEKLW